jgi:hypothetical protein
MSTPGKKSQTILDQLLKEQSNKFPVSRLVLPSIPVADVKSRDTSRYITLSLFRTRAYSPNPFYKNISRDLQIQLDENH